MQRGLSLTACNRLYSKLFLGRSGFRTNKLEKWGLQRVFGEHAIELLGSRRRRMQNKAMSRLTETRPYNTMAQTCMHPSLHPLPTIACTRVCQLSILPSSESPPKQSFHNLIPLSILHPLPAPSVCLHCMTHNTATPAAKQGLHQVQRLCSGLAERAHSVANHPLAPSHRGHCHIMVLQVQHTRNAHCTAANRDLHASRDVACAHHAEKGIATLWFLQV